MIKKLFKILIIFVLFIMLFLSGLYMYSYFSPKITIKSNNKFYIYDQNISIDKMFKDISSVTSVKFNTNKNPINFLLLIDNNTWNR